MSSQVTRYVGGDTIEGGVAERRSLLFSTMIVFLLVATGLLMSCNVSASREGKRAPSRRHILTSASAKLLQNKRINNCGKNCIVGG